LTQTTKDIRFSLPFLGVDFKVDEATLGYDSEDDVVGSFTMQGLIGPFTIAFDFSTGAKAFGPLSEPQNPPEPIMASGQWGQGSDDD
jgi:hypothetical protein